MKLFSDDLQTARVGNFNFSGVRPDKLGATEYTLVTVVVDKTGSVSQHAAELLAMKRAVVEACRKSPRAEFLMFRSVEFNHQVEEVHGFVELNQIDPTAYVEPDCKGSTALFDATFAAVAATNAYAKTLSDHDFNTNGIVFVITDGDDNVSVQTPRSIAEEVRRGVTSEALESLNVVLVGVNASRYQTTLEAFKQEAQLTQYVDVGDATPQKLAKLAAFVSQSVSSQSQSLGTGGPSSPLVF